MKLKEIHILTDDLTQTESFYHKVMGFDILPGDLSVLRLRAGKTVLVFHRSDREHPVYHLAFDIPNDKLEKALKWMKEKVCIIPASDSETIADFVNWNAKSFYFYDNNGNILEYITRFDLQNASGGAFDGSSVLHISEIGLVTANVPELASQITAGYRVETYPKQPPQEHFTVMGDEEGLFILASDKRNWFPTDKRAIPYWTKIYFHACGEDHELVLEGKK